MRTEDIKMLACANMVNNGRAFMVIQKPDWNGGHYCHIELPDYELGDFEYIRWEGTPAQYVKDKPVFDYHVEPFHEEPIDGEIDALTFISNQIKYIKL